VSASAYRKAASAFSPVSAPTRLETCDLSVTVTGKSHHIGLVS
jgi:hypothetical protein